MKELNISYQGENYIIVFKENKPQKTKIYNEKGVECKFSIRSILREEAKKLKLSEDGYLYDKSGVELITHAYFRKIYNYRKLKSIEEKSSKSININNKLCLEEIKMNDVYIELINLGFEKMGSFYLEDNNLKYSLNENSKYKSNILYAFLKKDEIKYIGKSTRGANNRLKQYCNPGKSQVTNTEVNKLIKKELEKNNNIDIYLFEDEGFSFKYIDINLPAGLEDNLIKKFKPKWNIIGKK